MTGEKALGSWGADDTELQKDHPTEQPILVTPRGGKNAVSLKAATSKAPRALGLRTAAMELAEAGIVGIETRHGDRVGRVRLGIGEEEVRLALGDDDQVKGLGLGS